MADDAGLAKGVVDRGLDAILAARRSQHTYRLTCRECDDTLLTHRREYGTCIECQIVLDVRDFQSPSRRR